MKKIIIGIVWISLMIAGLCINAYLESEKMVHVEFEPEEIVPKEIEPIHPDMQKLLDFLEDDKTDEIVYHKDPNRGIDYFVCTGFSRTLAENASEYNITMGVIGIRDHANIQASEYRHAMNYVIIDNQFMIIEPQEDDIFYLNTIQYYNDGVFKYITIHPNAEIMTNFGRHKYTIDIDLYGEYNETEICMKFPPVRY